MPNSWDSNAEVIDLGFEDDSLDFDPEQRRRFLEAEAQRIEDVIVNACRQEYEESKGAMAENLQRWDRYWAMYFNDFVPDKDDSPYKKINVPLLSRNIKLLHADLSKMTIPDKQRMDFFRAVPRRMGPGLENSPDLINHAKHSEYAIQQNLVDAQFGTEYKMALLDACVSGNGYFLHVWQQDVSLQETQVPNPDYDTVNLMNNVIEGPDGVLSFKEPYIWECQEVRTYDAPRSRHIDARNVFPSEMDKNNAKDCYGVSIYDTTSISELKENAIDDGGLLYTNLDKIKPSDEKRNVPEIDDLAGSIELRQSTRSDAANVGADVPKLRRITRFGRLDKEHLFPNQEVDPEAWAMFCEKFNIDPKKARYCKTWVVEMINEQVGVRIQPLPYKKDEIPLTHFRLFYKPNRTLGEGYYKLDEWEERTYNFFRRKGIELTQKVVDPPVAFRHDAFDQTWLQLHGNRFRYKPGMLVPMRNTNNVRDGFNPMQYDASPLAEIRNQQAQCNSHINSLSQLPAMKQGQVGDADSATEAGIAASSSDLYMDETAEDIEGGFLEPTVKWHYSLEQQFRVEPQFVNRLDNSRNNLEQFEVPPEVWLHDYGINIVGRRTVGNKAVQQMAFKEAMTSWLPQGIVNQKEAFVRHMRLMDIPDGEALWQDPAPAEPESKNSVAGKVDINELPGELQLAILAESYRGVAKLVNPPMPAQHLHEYPGDVVDGAPQQPGQPSQGSDDPNRSHHAQGEIENRQRGLHDAEGVTRSAGQTFRNPTNGRRAMSNG